VLRLVASERVVPAERLELKVRFKDGAAPASATFWLWVYPGQEASLVEVYRDKRTVEPCEQQVREQQEQLRQCHEANARLGGRADAPLGLVRLLAEGFMNDKGIQSKKLGRDITGQPGNVARVTGAWSYRSASRVAVALELSEASPARAWRAVVAELEGPDGIASRVVSVWQPEPLREGPEDRRVVVEAEAAPAEAQGRFTLKICDEDGRLVLELPGVTFP
jgi:uncharacterized protein (TIGR02268 family)